MLIVLLFIAPRGAEARVLADADDGDRATNRTALSCPQPVEAARLQVKNILSSEQAADIRQAHGIPYSEGSDLYVLGVVPKDDVICQMLLLTVQEALDAEWHDGRPMKEVSFFRYRGFYFTVSTPVIYTDSIRLLRTVVVIYDTDMNQLGAYAF